jgi:hypothetical protein
VIEGHTGIIFAWGTIINGAYLPGSFTYAYGFLQVGSIFICILVVLNHVVYRHLLFKNTGNSKTIGIMEDQIKIIFCFNIYLLAYVL